MSSKAYFDLTTLLRSRSEIAGLWGSLFLGQGGDVAGIRPYQPGDKLRHIHKPSFARGELMTKEFFGERRMSIRLLTDISRSTAPAGGFEPITAKAAKDGVELFWELIRGAADFWGVAVARDNAPSDPGPDFFQRIIGQWKGCLVFLLSDFYDGAQAYTHLFGRCKDAKVDLIPVFVDTSWIWRALGGGNFEFSGVDVGPARGAGVVRTDKGTISWEESAARARRERLSQVLKKRGLSWIHLNMPDFAGFVEEMTRCFAEKYRTSG